MFAQKQQVALNSPDKQAAVSLQFDLLHTVDVLIPSHSH